MSVRGFGRLDLWKAKRRSWKLLVGMSTGDSDHMELSSDTLRFYAPERLRKSKSLDLST